MKPKQKLRKKILVLHGPNLNLLGKREKKIYGDKTLSEINRDLKKIADTYHYEMISFQSNVEGEIVSHIQAYSEKIAGLLINPAAYTHTSIAIRDALLSTEVPKIEVHLSNIYKREPFRQQSLIADVVDGQISGFGWKSYYLGLEALVHSIESRRTNVQS